MTQASDPMNPRAIKTKTDIGAAVAAGLSSARPIKAEMVFDRLDAKYRKLAAKRRPQADPQTARALKAINGLKGVV